MEEVIWRYSENRKAVHIIQKYAPIYIGIAMGLYQIWSVLFATIDPINQMAIHLSFALGLSFLLFTPSKNNKWSKKLRYIDIFFIVLAFACGLYYHVEAERIATRIVGVESLTTTDIIFGLAFVLLSLEAARRTIGITINIVALVFIAYALFGHYLTGIWYHHPISIVELIDQLAFSYNGLWGSPISVAASFVFIFILFGSFLQASGASTFFFDLASAIAGRSRGGSAKIAIIASAFFGMISGSPAANVVTTGALTIPMAKKMGYASRFAAAVEACASTGGSLLPPIMGSSAFLMAAVTGISYFEIAIAALLPAVLFYFSLFFMIHLEALRISIPKNKAQSIPQVIEVLRTGWFHFLPLSVLVFFLLAGNSASRAGVYGIVTVIIVSWLRKKGNKMKVRQIGLAMANGAKLAIPVSAACAVAGLVIAGMMSTGLGGKINSIVLGATAGKVLPTLLLIMVICIVFGMGMPVAAAYILTAMLAAPALIQLGVNELTAHLFIVYFSVISAITPPVAVAAFAAAGIAGANPTKTGLEASRLGIVSFIIPFIFVFQPALLWNGTLWEILQTIVVVSIGLVLICCGMIGYCMRPIQWLGRLVMIMLGIVVCFL